MAYKDLIVWQKSMDLAENIYELIAGFPTTERYALSDQMRRAAISIPSNIAEGNDRNSPNDFARFLSIANGSAAELETQLLLGQRVGLISVEDANKNIALCQEIKRIMMSMILNIKTS